MPLYFFLSGLFFKPYENYSGFLTRKVNKLLIPFLFFHILSCIIIPLRHRTPFEWHILWDWIFSQCVYPNGPLWFLVCLLWLNQIFYALFKIANRVHYPVGFIIGSSIIIGITGYCIGRYGYNIDAMNIGTAMTAIPFFCAGYVFRRYTKILEPNSWDKYLPFIVLPLAFLTVYFAGPVHYFENQYDVNLLSVYGCGLSGVLCVLFISKMLGHLPLVSYFGRYSIMILVSHILVIDFFLPQVYRLNCICWIKVIILTSIVLLLSLIIIPIMKRYLPHVTAQKDLIPIRQSRMIAK